MNRRGLYAEWASLVQTQVAVRTLFLIFLVSLCATNDRILDHLQVAICLVAFIGIVFRETANYPLYWLVLSVLLIWNLLFNYTVSANHYFLSIYVALYLSVEAYYQRSRFLPQINMPRGLLAVVFGLATLHKFLSDYFMSGRLLATYILKGSSLYHTMKLLYPGFEENTIVPYLKTFNELNGYALVKADTIALSLPGPNFVLLCQVLAAAILVYELLLFVTCLVPKLFDSCFSQLALLGFVWGTLLFRDEYAFFGLVCTLFVMAKPTLSPLWKTVFSLSTILFLSLEMGDIWFTF